MYYIRGIMVLLRMSLLKEIQKLDAKKSQPGTVALSRAVNEKYKDTGTYGIYTPRLTRNGDKVSVHTEGRAWDCKCNVLTQKETGDEIFNLLIEKQTQLGIEKVIWDGKVWEGGDVKNYTGVNPHTNHLHIEQSVEKSHSLTYREIKEILG